MVIDYNNFCRCNSINETYLVDDFNSVNGIKLFARKIIIDDFRLESKVSNNGKLFIKKTDFLRFKISTLNVFSGHIKNANEKVLFFLSDGIKKEVFEESSALAPPSIVFSDNHPVLFSANRMYVYSKQGLFGSYKEISGRKIDIQKMDKSIRENLIVFAADWNSKLISKQIELSSFRLPEEEFSEQELCSILEKGVQIPVYFVDDQAIYFEDQKETLSYYLHPLNNHYLCIKSSIPLSAVIDNSELTVVSVRFCEGKPTARSALYTLQVRKWTTNISINKTDILNYQIDPNLQTPELKMDIATKKICIQNPSHFVFAAADTSQDMKLIPHSGLQYFEFKNDFFCSFCFVNLLSKTRSRFNSISQHALPEPRITETTDYIAISNPFAGCILTFSIDRESFKDSSKSMILINKNQVRARIETRTVLYAPDQQKFESQLVCFLPNHLAPIQSSVEKYQLIYVVDEERIPNNVSLLFAHIPMKTGKKSFSMNLFKSTDGRLYTLPRFFNDIKDKVRDSLVQFLLPDGQLIGSLDEFETESILHSMGYNVDARYDLSAAQRRVILRKAIDNRIRGNNTTSKLIDFISWLIKMRENQPFMQNAIAKWESDIEYLKTLPQTSR